MVLEIRLSNFFSIKEEIVLDFRAANIRSAYVRSLPENVFTFNNIQVIKSLAIYGANASGKSNIIQAIRFCHTLVYTSHLSNENTIFNFKPFKFDGFDKKPSNYFIRFVRSGIEYEYSFSLNRERIISEKLYYYPNGRVTKIFTRDEQLGGSKKEKYSFGTLIKRPYDVAGNTSDKTLFISRASQMDREIPKEIFNFFFSEFVLHDASFNPHTVDVKLLLDKAQILEALRIADSDIINVELKLLKSPSKNINADLDTLKVTVEDIQYDRLQIKTYHKAFPEVPFDFFSEESHGTIRFFFMILTILDVVKNNKVLLIDEIEDSLHPKIIEYIFNLFHSGKKAQLICTTHNTRFLDLKKFRKDQIYFANKKENASTDLYSMYDYSDFRETMDLEKAYYQGRFDAIPYVNDSGDQLKNLIYE